MRFTCDLVLPRTGDDTGVPTVWLSDRAISHDSRGALVYMVSFLEPGVEMTDAELDRQRHPGDMSITEMVDELVAAGYLELVSHQVEPYYRLVHPERRFGPLPVVE